MTKLAIVFWLLNIMLDTAGHISFKFAAVIVHDSELQRWWFMLKSPSLWVGITCFCLEFFVWFALLSVIPLSLAIMIGSINIVMLMLAGKIIFNEQLNRLRIAGMLLIAVGVSLSGVTL